MPGSSQSDRRSLRSQIHQESVQKQEPNERDNARNRRSNAMHFERQSGPLARGVRGAHADGAGAGAGRWRRAPAHPRRWPVSERGGSKNGHAPDTGRSFVSARS